MPLDPPDHRLLESIRQLFSHSTLDAMRRLDEAGVAYTFQPEALFITLFHRAYERLASLEPGESDQELLLYAQAIERFASSRFKGIDLAMSALISSGLYWLSGYTANSLVMARRAAANRERLSGAALVLLALLSRQLSDDQADPQLLTLVTTYLASGNVASMNQAVTLVSSRTDTILQTGSAYDLAANVLLERILATLSHVSLWAAIQGRSTAPDSVWQAYATNQLRAPVPLIDVWPSQRRAIASGLLDGRSSLVLTMPTSAGKTRISELALINDLFTDPRKCLYLAPFRALVAEIAASLGRSLESLRVPVAALYGGSDSNDLDWEYAERARVVVATPEKIIAVLRFADSSLASFSTIILDEGHVLGTRTRGAAYELHIARLRRLVMQGTPSPRLLFLSAVLPNAEDIARWLCGSADGLVKQNWHPTTVRIGVLRWPNTQYARIDYLKQSDSEAGESFFVPRVLETDEWQELNPATGRMRTRRFPTRSNKGSVAAALALKQLPFGPVIVFAAQPRWANGVAAALVEQMSSQRIGDAPSLGDDNRDVLSQLADWIALRLGDASLLATAMRLGVAIHHSHVPQGIRTLVEDAFRRGQVRLLIATGTIAQGVNLPAKTVIVHSLPMSDAPVRDFWNLVGRTGRALRETEGDLLVIQTDSPGEKVLEYVLNPANIEPVSSQVLELVRELLRHYPTVTPEAADTVSSASLAEWDSVIDAIDAHFLELMVEDIAATDPATIERVVQSTLAGQQAAQSGTTANSLLAGLNALFGARATLVAAISRDASTRKRFMRSGVSVRSCAKLDEALPGLVLFLIEHPDYSLEGLTRVFDVLCSVPEARALNAEELAPLAHVWMELGSYVAVLNSAPSQFDSIEDAVDFVEDVFVYRLPWIMNGLLRIAESPDETIDRPWWPEWVSELPQRLRFGVDGRPLILAMSLGFQDRGFVNWLVNRYESERGSQPSTASEIISWANATRETLLADVAAGWPPYFSELLGNTLLRYGDLSMSSGLPE